jgi:hypothetical protein
MKVIAHPIGKVLHRLEVWDDGAYIGDYERSQEADIPRKTQEIEAALPMLREVAARCGPFVVRWNGRRRAKVVYANDIEVAEIPKAYWEKPTWANGTRRGDESTTERPNVERPQKNASRPVSSSATRLGDEGEAAALDLLRARGFEASLLRRNYPTYDIRALSVHGEMLISVKASRDKQHVRLGSRSSVERLSDGNFVFAFLPCVGAELKFEPGGFRLLILPGGVARADSLEAHDAYYTARQGANEYSVMVKAYDSRHRAIWNKWLTYVDAWHCMPRASN